MTAPTTVYTYMPKKALEALLALGTPKLMLVDAAFTPNQDTNDFANDITNEAAGTGYASPGVSLASVVVNIDTAANTLTIDAADISGISVPCRWGILHVYTGSLSSSPVLGYVDFSQGLGGNVTLTGVTWNASGILQATVA